MIHWELIKAAKKKEDNEAGTPLESNKKYGKIIRKKSAALRVSNLQSLKQFERCEEDFLYKQDIYPKDLIEAQEELLNQQMLTNRIVEGKPGNNKVRSDKA